VLLPPKNTKSCDAGGKYFFKFKGKKKKGRKGLHRLLKKNHGVILKKVIRRGIFCIISIIKSEKDHFLTYIRTIRQK